MNSHKKLPARGASTSAFFAAISIFALISIQTALSATAKTSSAPLGSMGFEPSMERAVGWRGDGSGRFPGATPPTSWERMTNGNGYTTKGIVWMVPLPNIGVGSPVIVGDRIFLTSEVYDLVCQIGRASCRERVLVQV